MDEKLLIRCKDLAIGYEKPIISDINIDINKGSYICIIGSNGAGKSTFVKTLLGLIKPKKGNIDINPDISMSYLAQAKRDQRGFPISVTEVIKSGYIQRATRKQIRDRLSYLLKMFRLEEIADRPFSILSGGQQQRVLLARALCIHKDIILLDEPVTGLDAESTKTMYEVIKKLNEDEGITIVMITHDTEAANRYAKQLVIIQNNSFTVTDRIGSDKNAG